MHLDPSFDAHVRRVDATAAAALIDEGAVVLDVRTPDEFTGLGHIPGALLLPVQLVPCAPAVLRDPDAPVLVCCEHAVRSRTATRLLAQAGFTRVHELAGGMAGWQGPRAYDPAPVTGPSAWLVDNADLLPPGGRALDVACGAGRHALLLGAAGFAVTAVDRDNAALTVLQAQADRLGLTVQTRQADLERADVDLGDAGYDLIVVTRYLHRALMPHLLLSLAPGGVLLYETFLIGQAERGHPTNPAFLLEPGELPALVQPLRILRQFEGDIDGALMSAVVARRQ
ncbi:MAG: methyltransferase domain-containing protein [Acidobacteria bacterium]|nr:methyltransferase domain-containing protein [Acidobacteriota bacterium]